MIIAYYLGRKDDNPDTSLLDRLICWVTDSKYSHVEYVMSLNQNNVGTCWSSSPRDGGVRCTIINFNSGHWELYEIETYVSNNEINEWFMKYNHAKYDWLGVLGIAIPMFSQNKQRWFCSEAIAAAIGFLNPNKFTPEKLFRLFEILHHKKVKLNT